MNREVRSVQSVKGEWRPDGSWRCACPDGFYSVQSASDERCPICKAERPDAAKSGAGPSVQSTAETLARDGRFPVSASITPEIEPDGKRASKSLDQEGSRGIGATGCNAVQPSSSQCSERAGLPVQHQEAAVDRPTGEDYSPVTALTDYPRNDREQP